MNIFRRQMTKRKKDHFCLRYFDGHKLDQATNLLVYGCEVLSFSKNRKESKKTILYIKESDANILQCLYFKKKK